MLIDDMMCSHGHTCNYSERVKNDLYLPYLSENNMLLIHNILYLEG